MDRARDARRNTHFTIAGVGTRTWTGSVPVKTPPITRCPPNGAAPTSYPCVRITPSVPYVGEPTALEVDLGPYSVPVRWASADATVDDPDAVTTTASWTTAQHHSIALSVGEGRAVQWWSDQLDVIDPHAQQLLDATGATLSPTASMSGHFRAKGERGDCFDVELVDFDPIYYPDPWTLVPLSSRSGYCAEFGDDEHRVFVWHMHQETQAADIYPSKQVIAVLVPDGPGAWRPAGRHVTEGDPLPQVRFSVADLDHDGSDEALITWRTPGDQLVHLDVVDIVDGTPQVAAHIDLPAAVGLGVRDHYVEICDDGSPVGRVTASHGRWYYRQLIPTIWACSSDSAFL